MLRHAKAAAVADADSRERLDGGERPRGESQPLRAVHARGDGVLVVRGHEEELDLVGADGPAELGGRALGEVGDHVAVENGHLGEDGVHIARTLDEYALCRRAGSCLGGSGGGGGGGGGGRGSGGRGVGAGGRHGWSARQLAEKSSVCGRTLEHTQSAKRASLREPRRVPRESARKEGCEK